VSEEQDTVDVSFYAHTRNPFILMELSLRHFDPQCTPDCKRHEGEPTALDLNRRKEKKMTELLTRFWNNDEGQDIAEYALMLGVILVLVITVVSAIGTNANLIFSKVANALQ
jgi:Flp pilus assembly pilin Flp